MRLDLEKHPVEFGKNYPMTGVLSFGRGLFVKESIVDGATSYKHFLRIKRNHVVMSQLFGWEGALALASEEFEGRFLSPQFPTFVSDESRLSREFLGWWLKRPATWSELFKRGTGLGDRRRNLTPESLLSLPIPLPSLDEQRRIVKILDSASGLINKLQIDTQDIVSTAERLVQQLAFRHDLTDSLKAEAGWKQTNLATILKAYHDPVEVEPTASYPNIGMYSYARGPFLKSPIDGLSTSAKVLYRTKAGVFIYSRLFAFEGSYGVVDPVYGGHFVSSEYPMFEVDEEVCHIDFLWAYFKSPKVWAKVAHGSKGLGSRRQRVQPEQLLKHTLWLPPLRNQLQISAVRAKLNNLSALHAESTVLQNSFLPSLLDRAFKGEL